MESDRFLFALIGTVILVAAMLWAVHAGVALAAAGVFGPELSGLVWLAIGE